MSKLLEKLTVELDDRSKGIRIQYNNEQTIHLVQAEINTLMTKLRHVDIHNHWLHQM